ncbi:MAG: cyclic nucleotide-binding domain-containing protein [Gemmatimonadota bacterium]|nr:cyclic nucleotide-binding domain-containing protein [Gemmatimonadota bacterium]
MTSSVDARVQRALFLRKQAFLGALPAAALFALEKGARDVVLRSGEKLPAPNDEQTLIAAVVDGTLSARQADGTERLIGPGGLAGLTHVLAEAPRMALEATRPTRLLLVDDETLEELIERYFVVVEVLIHHLARSSLAALATLPDGTALGASEAGRPKRVEALDFVDRLAMLTHAESIPPESLNALSELAGQVHERRWRPGEILWRAGEPAEDFLVMAEGSIECAMGAGRHHHLGYGASVGKYEALIGLPRRFTAVVAQPLTALVVNRDLFFDLLEDHGGMARDFLRALARRKQALESMLAPSHPES